MPENCAAEKQTDLKTDYWARSQREILASTSLARGNENVHLKPQAAVGETEPGLTNALNRPFKRASHRSRYVNVTVASAVTTTLGCSHTKNVGWR